MSRSDAALHTLLAATNPRDKDLAWRAFVAEYSRLLIHTARTVLREHDDAMDAYAFILEALGDDDCARLRGFANDGRSRFTTWLVVVARRLCLDFHRHRFGRVRGEPSEAARHEHLVRQRLVRMIGVEPETAGLVSAVVGADDAVAADEVRAALTAAVDALPPADRTLIALRFEDDLSAQHIARIVGLPSPFHVYRRLESIMKTLRRQLESRGVSP